MPIPSARPAAPADTSYPRLIFKPCQFYDEAFTLLSRLLDLLRSFMNRSHQRLAAVGVAAFVRLCVNAGEPGKRVRSGMKARPLLLLLY